MQGLIIEVAYLVVGLLVGYIFGKGRTDSMENMVYSQLKAGKRVMIAVDDTFMSYEYVDGKILMKMGNFTAHEKDETNGEPPVDTNGPV